MSQALWDAYQRQRETNVSWGRPGAANETLRQPDEGDPELDTERAVASVVAAIFMALIAFGVRCFAG